MRITITGLHLIRDRTIKAHEAGVGALERPLVFYDLWDLHGVPLRMLARRTWKSLFADRVPGHAAELGFYFFFAVFSRPFLRQLPFLAWPLIPLDQFFWRGLLDYLALVIPKPALGTVLHTFVQITANATTGKVTFGFVGALWSASVGIAAIQDTLNVVYKIRDSRSYFQARFYAIALTIILFVVVTLILACLFGATFVAAVAHRDIRVPLLAQAAAVGARIIGWFLATVLLALSFALIYHCAPDTKDRRFQLITPGTAFGILGWLVASLGLRIYLHYFDTFPVTYGSLGAVIILLTWFYITGLMILLGAEINSGIEAATEETRSADSPVSTTEMQTRMNDSQKSIEGP